MGRPSTVRCRAKQDRTSTLLDRGRDSLEHGNIRDHIAMKVDDVDEAFEEIDLWRG